MAARQRVGLASAEKTLDGLGTPHAPIWVPRVSSIVYLGIVASFQGFEMQTLRHRLQAAAQNKHRLLKVLHNKVLTVHERVRLYCACVRSALLYGLHATGHTPATVQKLDAFDIRALRAIAKSPVHLTKESNLVFRARLRTVSPTQSLLKMLDKRLDTVVGPPLDWFRQIRNALEEAVAAPSSTADVRFTADGVPGVPCPECGITFSNHRVMLTHRSRWHGITKAKRPKIADRTHMQHSVDGMPHCRHCEQKFQRFEGFRKHLPGACPVLCPPVTLIKVNHTEESAAGDGVQVAAHQEVPLGTAPHADSKDSAPVLINDSDFRENSLHLRDGGSRLAGHGHAEPDPVHDETRAATRERALQPTERDGLHALYRHGAVHVPGDAEAGGGEVAGAVRGQQGDVLPGTDPYVGNGPGPEDQAGGGAPGRVPGPALQELRVDQRWRQRLLADVAFLRVEPGRKEGVPVDNPAAPPHQDSGDAGGDGKKSSPAEGAAQVPGHEGHADGGSPESFRSAPAALGKRGDEAPGSSSSTGARPATASGEASGDLVQGHELLGLEPVPELEVADLGRSATVALREVQQWERPLLSMPGARLRNPHNVCYINS